MSTPYRTHAESIDKEGKASSGTLLTLDVSGRRGMNGADGEGGSAGHYAGDDGGVGAPAGPAHVGENAGAIDVWLVPDGDTKAIVRGSVRYGGGSSREVFETIDFAEAGPIVLAARGGAGGRGGTGGTGGDGATGQSGSDATRYSNGGDGGAGGRGGDGGDGSDGAPGGLGGRITVHVSEDDTHLLMLVAHEVSGGRGGDAGQNGQGGVGGMGGSGGSSYSWTTSSSSTDSQGRRTTTTHHHSNPGGSRGPSGSRGRSATRPLSPGADGRAGAFEIIVHAASGETRSYPSRYEVVLRTFAHENENQDGIYEPEEHVVVRQIAIENIGGMPTPPNHAITVAIIPNEWVHAERLALTALPSLPPGGRAVVPGELGFTIGRFVPGAPSDPLASKASIHLGAQIASVRRAFAPFESVCPPATGTFLVEFPVVESPVSGLVSLAPGEATSVSLSVTNASRKPFGSATEGERSIVLRTSLGMGDLSPASIVFRDDAGELRPLDGTHTREVTSLAAGDSASFTGTLHIAADAEAYTAARFVVTLMLGRLRAPLDPAIVQMRELVVRVAKRFVPSPDAEVLLVVNNRTTREEVDAWENAARDFSTKLAIWDVSLEGHAELDREIPGGSLSAQFREKTIIILNTELDGPNGPERALSLFSHRELDAFATAGGQIAIVGKIPKIDWLHLAERHATHSGVVVREEGLPTLAEEAGQLQIGESAAPWGLTMWKFFGVPNDEHLAARARTFARRLERSFKERRFGLALAFDGGMHASAPIGTRYLLGTVRAFRRLDVDHRGFVLAARDDATIHDPNLVASLAPLIIAWSLPYDRRLRDLGRASLDPESLECFPLPSTITSDGALLSILQGDLLREWRGAYLRGRHDAPDDVAFPILTALASGRWLEKPPLPTEGAGVGFVALLSFIVAVARAQVRFWEYLPPFYFFRKAPRLAARVSRIADAALEKHFDHVAKPTRALFKSERKKRAAEIENACSELPRGTWQRLVDMERFFHVWAEGWQKIGVRTSEDFLTPILDEGDCAKVLRIREKQAHARKGLAEAIADARTKYVR